MKKFTKEILETERNDMKKNIGIVLRRMFSCLEEIRDGIIERKRGEKELKETWGWKVTTGSFNSCAENSKKYICQNKMTKKVKEMIESGEVTVSNASKKLVHEHVFSRSQFTPFLVDWFLKNDPSREEMIEFIKEHYTAVVVTKEEDKLLPKTLVEGNSNPWKRYEVAGLLTEIVEVKEFNYTV